MAIKFCVKCGKQFKATGREVICPSCKQAAAEEAKRAAVLKAKRASWAGESVPVRISGRASTIIREYGKAHNLPFAAALDALLQASAFFKSTSKAWQDVEPYRSHRRDKHTTEGATETAQEVNQDGKEQAQDTASKPQEVKQAARVAKPATASKKASSKPSKPSKSVKK